MTKQPESQDEGQAGSRDADRLKVNMSAGVLRTLLDRDALNKVAAKVSKEKELLIKRDVKFRAAPDELSQAKEFVSFRPASACDSRWDEMEGEGRVRFCKQCKHQVYDLEGMEKSDCDSLVFKQENKSNVTYYRRSDGKFLTSDCSVGLNKKARKVALLTAAGVCIAGIIALVLVMPRAAFVSQPTLSTSHESAGGEIGTDKTKQPAAGHPDYRFHHNPKAIIMAVDSRKEKVAGVFKHDPKLREKIEASRALPVVNGRFKHVNKRPTY